MGKGPKHQIVELPEEVLRAWPNDEINELPLCKWEGTTHVVRSPKKVAWALERLEADPVLGFDTETRPVFKKGQQPGPPSLLQLATADEVFLFQLKLTGLENGLAELLSRRSVIKTGVSVRDDIIGLKKLFKFKAGGFIDVGEVSMDLKMQTHGLRNLAANLLGFRISKAAQCSNWSKDQLSPKQVAYAATDAWVSRELYMAMRRLGVFEQPN
ncbi:MAG: 3'-5' exonuclease [Desulfovibrionaceae bacterium]